MLAGPIYLCVAFLFVVIFYVAYNFTITLPVDSINTITGLSNSDSLGQPSLNIGTEIPTNLMYVLYDVHHIVSQAKP